MSSLAIRGEVTSGQDVRTQNVMAAMAIANIVKSSLGPVGLDKMLVDEMGDVVITNDGATILKRLEVEHPAGKILVQLANLQDEEVGDGTTSVVVMAAEILKQANELVKNNVHPTSIISGLLLAKKEAIKFIKQNMCISVEQLGHESIINAAKTSMSSKIIGMDSEFFANLAVEAVLRVKTVDGRRTEDGGGLIGDGRYGAEDGVVVAANVSVEDVAEMRKRSEASAASAASGSANPASDDDKADIIKATAGAGGKAQYPVKSITILKAHGKSARESELVDGFALNSSRASQAMPSYIKKAKIALLDFDLRQTRMPLGVSVQVSDPQKLIAIQQREKDLTSERIKMILNSGANVVLTTQGIDDMSMKYFVEAGVIACRRVNKRDLKQLAKATGARILLTLSDYEDGEALDKGVLGQAEEVMESRIGDGELIYFKGCATSRAQTIVLRGANDYMLDEIERSLHDAMMVVKRVLESKYVVPGGGAVETALSVYMESLAEQMGSREQLALASFARSLLVIPKTIAVNGAFDAVELVAQLRARHYASQTKESKKKYRWYGLDLDNGVVRDNVEAGVLEPALAKVKMIRFATEAAVTLLRIDDNIRIAPKMDPRGPVEDDY